MSLSSQVPGQPLPSNLPFQWRSGTIGSGAYAFIRKASPRDAPKPLIAIKVINKERAYTRGRVKPKQIQAEIALHQHVGKHQNIIQFLTSGENPHWVWIAMELATGDLFDKIEADVGVPEEVAHFYFSQLISAVGYMHSKCVAHRDIKPENILLAEGELKMADFGLAVLFAHKGVQKPCQTVCGSPPYMAPEVVPKDGFTGRKTAPYQGDLADIWSCGIVLFVLLVGNTPWDEPTKNSDEYRDYVESNFAPSDELWTNIPHGAKSLLRGMLRPDPSKRMTLEDVRRHPWFTRPNHFLSPDGRAANPIGLATQMLEKLHIDFNADPLASSQRVGPMGAATQMMEGMSLGRGDAMDVDDQSQARLAFTQPEEPVAEIDFEWERRGVTSLSQPNRGDRTLAAADLICQDPVMSQFSATPAVPVSLTQRAKRFSDIMPSEPSTIFYSFTEFDLLIKLLSEALARLGIQLRQDIFINGGPVDRLTIPIKTRDQRKVLLAGAVIVENLDGDALSIHFMRLKGDPVEWRRLFKKVTVLCKDGVLRSDAMEE